MSVADLETEVARLKARMADRAGGVPLERLETARLASRDILSVSSVMPEVIGVFERLAERSRKMRETLRAPFDAARETVPCEMHPGAQRRKLWEETCRASQEAGVFSVAYAPCARCQEERTLARRRAYWSRRGVPERVLEATLANFSADAPEKAAALAKVSAWARGKGVFLALTGLPGTGKGHLASACMKVKGDGLFITHADMLQDLRASYSTLTTQALVDGWRHAPMLVLDELGLSPGGRDEEPMLFQVLATRHDSRRPTIITSNLELADLRAALGGRLLDRVTEDCCTVVCRWESHRRRGGK